jgi:hypothetical protein
MHLRLLLAVVTGVSCFMLAGCDPVRTTRQTVTLTVLDSQSGEGIASADVRLKDDFDRRDHTSPDTATEEEWEVHARQSWKQAPWFHGQTDKKGSATVNVEYTTLDKNRGNVVPDSRDRVSGKPFLVDISAVDTLKRTFSIIMTPGEVATNLGVSVRVDDVQAPTYIPTQ